MNSLVHHNTGTPGCSCGACRPAQTAISGCTHALAKDLAELTEGQQLALIGDAHTLKACGHSLAADLTGLSINHSVLALDADGPLHADTDQANSLARHLNTRPDLFPIAVGSGTINDLVKFASFQLNRPYGVVATAASMNGYTSSVAALTEGTIKKTIPTCAPQFVIANPQVLAEAPKKMTLAGLADLLSKGVSSADWKLASIMTQEPFCPYPVGLAHAAVERAVELADDLYSPTTAAALFHALVLSGESMTIAGHSAPASGAEHLVSHFLDMTAEVAPDGVRTPALHGLQVGLGIHYSTQIWETVLRSSSALANRAPASKFQDDLSPSDSSVANTHHLSIQANIEAYAPWIPPTMQKAITEVGMEKLSKLGLPTERRQSALNSHEEIKHAFESNLKEALNYRALLRRLNAPTTASEVLASPKEIKASIFLGRYIRNRYTILDYADDLFGLDQFNLSFK